MVEVNESFGFPADEVLIAPIASQRWRRPSTMPQQGKLWLLMHDYSIHMSEWCDDQPDHVPHDRFVCCGDEKDLVLGWLPYDAISIEFEPG